MLNIWLQSWECCVVYNKLQIQIGYTYQPYVILTSLRTRSLAQRTRFFHRPHLLVQDSIVGISRTQLMTWTLRLWAALFRLSPLIPSWNIWKKQPLLHLPWPASLSSGNGNDILEVVNKAAVKELTDHLNSIDDTNSIKFTYEEEKEGKMPFLDTHCKTRGWFFKASGLP